jgi:hypothetical protein
MIDQTKLDAFAAAITANYYAENPDSPWKDYTITFEEGKKYIRVVKSTGSQRSVHSFIEIENGDIWKAASWKVPAKNKPRGNLNNLTPRVCSWTSAT